MENTNSDQTSPTNNSTAPKRPFSITSYLSPNPFNNRTGGTITKMEGLFNTQLIAAMINWETVLLEDRDCILIDDQDRCKRLSKQIHAKWRSLSVNNGCISVENRLAIPHIMKESVIDVPNSTQPGAWGLTELGHRLWWPF